jgi:hypothetical protein
MAITEFLSEEEDAFGYAVTALAVALFGEDIGEGEHYEAYDLVAMGQAPQTAEGEAAQAAYDAWQQALGAKE